MERLIAVGLDYLGLKIKDIGELLVTKLSNRYKDPTVTILGKTFRPIMTSHHDNHIGTTFPSKFKDAIIVCADGGSEDGTTKIYKKTGNEILLLENLDQSSFNGRFYGTATQLIINPKFAMAHNTDAGKLMGLSAMGHFDQELWDLIDKHEVDFNRYYIDSEPEKVVKMRELFSLTGDYNKPWEDERTVNFAYAAHNFWANGFFNHLKKYAGANTSIALSGGCALNITLNSLLANSGLFKNVYVSPISSDSGQSIGAILYRHPHLKCEYPFLGRGFGKEGEYNIDQIVKDLIDGKIIAWYQGRSEIGPRALGHRSFLGIANTTQMRDKLSILVKKREAYRPVAAIIAQEEVGKYFETKGDTRYMTFNATARDITQKEAPAIVHYDGTSRIQSIGPDDNPILHKCLLALKEKTGTPIIMNSSFNVAGEPIVDTPVDALRNFANSQADVLYINGKRIDSKTTGIEALEVF